MPLFQRIPFVRPAFVCAGALACASAAIAQSGTRTIMRGNEDGTHEVLMLTAPDYISLRNPDFQVRDLDIMRKKLVLSDEQQAEFRRHIEQYLIEFRNLTKEFAAATAPEAEFIPDDERIAMAAQAPPEEPQPAMTLEGIDVPPGVNVGISTGISTSTSDDPNVPPPPPKVEISVTLDSQEGEEVPQEIIDQIRQRGEEVAARMIEHLIKEEQARQAGEEPLRPIIQPMNDFESIKADHDALTARADEFKKAKAQLRARFVLDAQASLAPAQVELWPSLERALYRDRSFPMGQLPVETFDLVKFIENWKMTDQQRQQIGPLMEALEIVLDDALHQRDALLATAPAEIDQAIANRKPDLALTLTDRVTTRRMAVRNIIRTHIEQFALGWGDAVSAQAGAQTAPGFGEAFRLAARQQCYPQVFGQTRGMKMFESVRKIDGLDAETIAAIDELEAAYLAELASVNEQLCKTIDQERAAGSRRGIEHLKASMEGASSDGLSRENPERKLFIKRAEMGERYRDLLEQLLGPEHAGSLPKARITREPIQIKSGNMHDDEQE